MYEDIDKENESRSAIRRLKSICVASEKLFARTSKVLFHLFELRKENIVNMQFDAGENLFDVYSSSFTLVWHNLSISCEYGIMLKVSIKSVKTERMLILSIVKNTMI